MTCPICANHVCASLPERRKRKRKPKARRYTLSVSAKAFETFKAAAEARGWSVRRLVEEACK